MAGILGIQQVYRRDGGNLDVVPDLSIAEILLVGGSQSTIDKVKTATESVANCQLSCASLAQAPSRISSDTSLVILHPEDESSSSVLAAAKKCAHRPPVIVVTDQPQLKWVDMGASDCLSLDVDMSRLAFLVDAMTLKTRAVDETKQWLKFDDSADFCIASEKMARLAARARKVAKRKSNVLIAGATGTGKTHLASMLHALSARRDESFVAVNCASIPESLIESELFGHVRGAFTGADCDRAGVFAMNGTVFLDEVDALPLGAQAKLLHIADNRGFAPVGCRETRKFNGRLIVATNRDLEQLTREGLFRRDLFYRLSVLVLEVPPLSERTTDIELLAKKYLELQSTDETTIRSLSGPALEAMLAYDWPGNVRELNNVLENAIAFSTNAELELEDLPEQIARLAPLVDKQSVLDDSLQHAREDGEARFLQRLLTANKNNRAKTARQLGISRSALYKRLQKFGLT